MKKMIIGLVAGLLIGSVGTVAASSPTVQAVFQKFVLDVEGQTHNIEPLVYQGTTYLPVREVSGLLNYDVKYDGKTRTIQLNEKGADSVNNVATEEWIGFRDFFTKYNASWETSDDPKLETKLIVGEKSINMESIGYFDGEKTLKTSNGTLRLKVKDSVTYLYIPDLIKLGLIDQ